MAVVSAPRGRYIAFGRRIATDVAVPGAIPDPLAEGAAGPPEILIRRTVPRPPRGVTTATLWREGAVLHFAPRTVAEYRITAGSIEVAPCPGATEDDISALLIATALPALLWLNGAVMLHAAAAILPGRASAVAIAAPSGTGKSTMLAQFVAHGARIVGDDSLCLYERGAGIMASGLAGGYFAHHPDAATRPFVTVLGGAIEASLGAILLLSRHAGDAPATIRRLAPFQAVSGLLSHRHRAAVPRLFGDPAERLGDIARVARVPVHAWSRPEGSVGLTPAEWHAIDRLGGGCDDDGTAMAASG